jgi:hypothetical protein
MVRWAPNHHPVRDMDACRCCESLSDSDKHPYRDRWEVWGWTWGYQSRLVNGSAWLRLGSVVGKVCTGPGPVLRVSNRTVTRPWPAPWTQPCP